jgi:hypothetical protein
MVEFSSKQNEARAAKSVVVIYEDSALRERAVQFCERLAAETPEMEMDWWSFQLLDHPSMAHSAVDRAATADVVVFAMVSRGDLPEEIKMWIERWLNKRGEREGALVGLLHREEGWHGMASFREIYLRHVARRSGMDYLSHSAPTIQHAIPDSLDSYNDRAVQMTSVLDSILREHPETERGREARR